MELKRLFPQVKTSFPVSGLHFDSRFVQEDGVFFAVKGFAQDGHDYLKEAVGAGARALVVSDPERVPTFFSGELIVVFDVRSELARAAQVYFDFPARDMVLFGVTGTNGKTTSVYMFEELFRRLGLSCGVMGTIDHHFKEKVWKSRLTTPDVIGLYSRLREMKNLGAGHAALEISSHALDQKRVDGLSLDVGVWTNFTRDHLDYHKTEEAYFAAKEEMFLKHIKKNGFALFNGDDERVRSAEVSSGVKKYFFGMKGDFRFSQAQSSLEGARFYLETPYGNSFAELATPGEHNVYNAVGVMSAALCLGHPFAEVVKGLENFKGAPGRLELVHKAPHVFVDYAHTPDALRQSLLALNNLKSADQKIIAVFGFGGDRDPGKRPLMVNEAVKLADRIILTSDNPRSEDPEKILRDGLRDCSPEILSGKIKIEVERKKGIHLALEEARSNDVILVAGKGHEDYQIIGERTLSFSDREVVKGYFN